ncbi:hypothetical protein TpMuguga_03g00246 [Theileria parva strain Muguga]|uniref:Uncharacterized protein n=1 Tax=Theileria parva TaxID=5875 RepID=Q4N0A5_THEPA|nr:uncharacterized protein TpMuguga_03g00246 [Theileria parva strain Muguga]EAN30981.1 hypothetical protein TpMuguga_03g00246 [Theileria parva strain Muguga]|eukprot:XP_763264.1 hypothetical protein [Theileria parva strain Muguga]
MGNHEDIPNESQNSEGTTVKTPKPGEPTSKSEILTEIFKNVRSLIKSATIFDRELGYLNETKIMVGELITPLILASLGNGKEDPPLKKTVDIVQDVFLRLNAVQLYIQLAKMHTEKLMEYRKRFSKCSNKDDEAANEKRLIKTLHRIEDILENKLYAKLILQSGYELLKTMEDVSIRDENGMVDLLAMYKIQSPLEYHFKAKFTTVLDLFEQNITYTHYSLQSAIDLSKLSGYEFVTISGTGIVLGDIIEETLKLDDITMQPITGMDSIINERILSLDEVDKRISGHVEDKKSEPGLLSGICDNIVSIFS